MALTNMTARSAEQLPATKGTLFTATGAQWVLTITVHNTTGGPLPVNLYLNNGTSRQIYANAALAANTPYTVRGPFALLSGDLVEGDDGGTGAAIDFWVSVAGPGT